jgi:hypothetical protein
MPTKKKNNQNTTKHNKTQQNTTKHNKTQQFGVLTSITIPASLKNGDKEVLQIK